jgi:hypothetical protein
MIEKPVRAYTRFNYFRSPQTKPAVTIQNISELRGAHYRITTEDIVTEVKTIPGTISGIHVL